MKTKNTLILAVALSIVPMCATAQSYDGNAPSLQASSSEDSKPLFDTKEAIEATKKIAEKQSRVNELKVDLNIEQIENQIRALQDQKKELTVEEMIDERLNTALEAQKAELQTKHDDEMKAIVESQAREVEKLTKKLEGYENKRKISQEGLRSNIFVTSVKTGSQSVARIFADGYVTNRTIGEEIVDGVVLQDITIRGIYVVAGNNRSFIPLESTVTAYNKTYSESEVNSEQPPSEDEIQNYLERRMATPSIPQGSGF